MDRPCSSARPCGSIRRRSSCTTGTGESSSSCCDCCDKRRPNRSPPPLRARGRHSRGIRAARVVCRAGDPVGVAPADCPARSEEHTSELQSRLHLVCRLLLEKKKKKQE